LVVKVFGCLVMLAKVKDMFVMNFGAGYYDPINDRWVEAIIPNDAIESQNGFPGAGVPGEGGRGFWLLNADEGAGYPLRVVNFLWGYAHRRDVYAAIVVPGVIDNVYQDTDLDGIPDPNDNDKDNDSIPNDQDPDDDNDGIPDNQDDDDDNDGIRDASDNDRINAYGFTYGPIWDQCAGPIAPPRGFIVPSGYWGSPVIEVDVNLTIQNSASVGLRPEEGLTFICGHELGHAVLWENRVFGYGHHGGGTTQDCFMWVIDFIQWRNPMPREFCANNPGCQRLWKLNP